MSVIPLNRLDTTSLSPQELAQIGEYGAIIIGAGHNGLTAAARLASQGVDNILVLERSDHIGGACTLKEWSTPAGKLIISPCAYLCVMEEFDFVGRGFEWHRADGGLFVPFGPQNSVMLYCDDDRCLAEIKRFAPEDADGWQKMMTFLHEVASLLRSNDNARDFWVGDPPTEDELAKRLEYNEDRLNLVLRWSMVDLLDKFHISNPNLRTAIIGQGIIGTFATPETPGTAYIYLHHSCGRMFNKYPDWGYVIGGMGMISRILFDVCKEKGVKIVTSCPVKEIVIEDGFTRGVRLSDGTFFKSNIVISNADPKTTLNLLQPSQVPSDWRSEIEAISLIGNCAKVNLAMRALPDFAKSSLPSHQVHTASVNLTLTVEEWRTSLEQVRQGELASKVWCEIYFQTAVRPDSVSENGLHHISILVQPVPYKLRDGRQWTPELRQQVIDLVISQMAQHCTNIPQDIVDTSVMVPVDIETEIGMHGGHIFHGECLPDQMWWRRLKSKTPIPGLYLCGAGTHPGGSVIAINGWNAANKVLAEFSAQQSR